MAGLWKRSKLSYFGLRGGWLTFWVTVACGTDMTLFGYDQGVFAGVIVSRDFLDVLGLHGRSSMIGTITAMYNVGCFFGAIATMIWGERLGRKACIMWGTLLMAIGAVLQVACFSVPQMIVGRIIAGIGNGINTSTAPVWQGETSQVKWRGKLIVAECVLNIAGFSFSNWMTFAFSFIEGPVSWRFPLAFQFFYMIIIFATVPWLPESPRWLISHDRHAEAQQIIADLENANVNDPLVITEMTEISAAINHEREHGLSWRQLISGRGDKDETCAVRRMILGAGAQAMGQLAGINVTSYYLPTVLIQSVGLSEKLARLLAACNSIVYLLAGILAIPNIEKRGRRPLLMVCACGQGLCYLLITVLLRFSEKDGYTYQKEVASAAVAFFFCYYVFFGCGFQGPPWLIPVEINSLGMRTKGTALSTAVCWASCFMVAEVTPIGIENLGWRFYMIWTVFNFSWVPVFYFFYPETANRTLEDVDRFFAEHKSLLVHRIPEATMTSRPARYLEIEERILHQSTEISIMKQGKGDI